MICGDVEGFLKSLGRSNFIKSVSSESNKSGKWF